MKIIFATTLIFLSVNSFSSDLNEKALICIDEEKYKRMLFKTGDNSGFIIEVFENISVAGKKIETMKALQGLGEQAMAKVSVQEGSVIKK